MEKDVTIYDNDRRFIFSNWTNSDFTGIWGGVATLVKKGETIELPMFKAYHFAKHLVNREIVKQGDNIQDSPEARRPLEEKTIAEITANVDSPAMATLKEKIKEQIKVEGGEKAEMKNADVAQESTVKEFEDIEDNKKVKKAKK